MNEEVRLRLALAKQYAHHANFSGTPRQAVADGYSAVDAVLSALLLYGGIEPPRNHSQKFDQARKKYPDAFNAELITREGSSIFLQGADWNSLETYYEEWLTSRYEAFDIRPMAASDRVREALRVVDAAIRFLAKEENIDADELEKEISKLAFGYGYSEVSVAVSDAHDYLFQEAEAAGEERGAKLGVKLATATNYCDLDIVAGDAVMVSTDFKHDLIPSMTTPEMSSTNSSEGRNRTDVRIPAPCVMSPQRTMRRWPSSLQSLNPIQPPCVRSTVISSTKLNSSASPLTALRAH
jgi:hypothetical protein